MFKKISGPLFVLCFLIVVNICSLYLAYYWHGKYEKVQWKLNYCLRLENVKTYTKVRAKYLLEITDNKEIQNFCPYYYFCPCK